jgi:hypothetical protein
VDQAEEPKSLVYLVRLQGTYEMPSRITWSERGNLPFRFLHSVFSEMADSKLNRLTNPIDRNALCDCDQSDIVRSPACRLSGTLDPLPHSLYALRQ